MEVGVEGVWGFEEMGVWGVGMGELTVLVSRHS